MGTACSLPYRWVSAWRGGLCPGVSVWGVSVQGGLCPGGALSRGSLSIGVPVRETWDQRQRPPGRNMRPETENPLKVTWDQAGREEVTLYRGPLPSVNRMTDNISVIKTGNLSELPRCLSLLHNTRSTVFVVIYRIKAI